MPSLGEGAEVIHLGLALEVFAEINSLRAILALKVVLVLLTQEMEADSHFRSQRKCQN